MRVRSFFATLYSLKSFTAHTPSMEVPGLGIYGIERWHSALRLQHSTSLFPNPKGYFLPIFRHFKDLVVMRLSNIEKGYSTLPIIIIYWFVLSVALRIQLSPNMILKIFTTLDLWFQMSILQPEVVAQTRNTISIICTYIYTFNL